MGSLQIQRSTRRGMLSRLVTGRPTPCSSSHYPGCYPGTQPLLLPGLPFRGVTQLHFVGGSTGCSPFGVLHRGLEIDAPATLGVIPSPAARVMSLKS